MNMLIVLLNLVYYHFLSELYKYNSCNQLVRRKKGTEELERESIDKRRN